MPPSVQAKLLRVFQDGVIKPLGGQERKVRVRVVAATNMDLGKAIRDGGFRADLAQRFIDTVELPPLRRRRGDIVKLATFALTQWNREYGESRKIGRDALEKLQAYAWPGNVRELISAVQRSAMMAKATTIHADDLHLGDAAWQTGAGATLFPEPCEGFSLKEYLNDARESLVRNAIEIAAGNYAAAARLLGVSTQAVHKYARTRGKSWREG
jgi:two-component system, NtrC family, response regulator